ncbi:hypothetical protein [Rhizobium sp. FY34]|uniref:hypothetical protein n=1 Tax=Rhizobium sp. FY34 TaxID=2562309 RepID=UPI0010BF7793|nr:hypothetical protein [Rhizobium sp. FY34]
MAMNENNLDYPLPSGSRSKLKGSALHPLHEAAMRLAGLGINRPKERTRDLVSLLLSHGARAWRQAQPEANIHLHIASRSGRAPLRLKLR